jgi:hypothetical protein
MEDSVTLSLDLSKFFREKDGLFWFFTRGSSSSQFFWNFSNDKIIEMVRSSDVAGPRRPDHNSKNLFLKWVRGRIERLHSKFFSKVLHVSRDSGPKESFFCSRRILACIFLSSQRASALFCGASVVFSMITIVVQLCPSWVFLCPHFVFVSNIASVSHITQHERDPGERRAVCLWWLLLHSMDGVFSMCRTLLTDKSATCLPQFSMHLPRSFPFCCRLLEKKHISPA